VMLTPKISRKTSPALNGLIATTIATTISPSGVLKVQSQ